MRKKPLPVVDEDMPYHAIPVTVIRAWPGNPRKHFDEKALAELAESIKVKGVLQPILVRPIPAATAKHLKASAGDNGKARSPRYEIAAGERRWRAAGLAGLAVIPVIVKELSDKDLLECAVVENEQREDITPLEKADGYAALIASHGSTLEDIAGRVGKSVSTIRAVLRLRSLPASARQALDEGKISVSIAELIAARPNDEMRGKVAKYALSPQDAWDGMRRVADLPSYRNVRGWIERECMVELKKAPFNPSEIDLTSAGACTSCPKRTGNDREQYPEGRADLCTDPACYRDKVQAWTERAMTLAKEQGQQFLAAAETNELFPFDSRLSGNAPYYDLADDPWWAQKGKKRPSLKQLLERHLELKDIVLCVDPLSVPHRLVRKTIADPILKEKHGIDRTRVDGYDGRTSPAAKQKAHLKARRDGWIKRRTEELMLTQAAEQAEGLSSVVDRNVAGMHKFALALTISMMTNCWPEGLQAICRRREVPGKSHTDRLESLKKYADAAELDTLFGLLAEMICSRHLLGVHGAGGKKQVQAFLNCDYSACQKQARQEFNDKKRRNGTAARQDSSDDVDQADDGQAEEEVQPELELDDNDVTN